MFTKKSHCIICKNSLPKERKYVCYKCAPSFDLKDDFENEEDEKEKEEDDGYCPACNGSGQGMYDGSACSSC